MPPDVVAAHVMTCVPTDSALVVTDAPLPNWPSRSDVHEREARSADPIPLNLSVDPAKKVDPSAGAVIVATGGSFVIVTVI